MEQLQRRQKSQKGFSLVELIIVIAILAILATVGFQVFGNITAKSKTTAMVTNATVIVSTLNDYYTLKGSSVATGAYMSDLATLKSDTANNTGILYPNLSDTEIASASPFIGYDNKRYFTIVPSTLTST